MGLSLFIGAGILAVLLSLWYRALRQGAVRRELDRMPKAIQLKPTFLLSRDEARIRNEREQLLALGFEPAGSFLVDGIPDAMVVLLVEGCLSSPWGTFRPAR